ncbi:MAG: hypothetical protein GX072_13050 [Lysinibacillus sp.]|nr:hypothetical protein [Lysinibacillus sp.]
MQVNKHGIPVASKRKSIKKQVQQEIHNILDFREFVEFVRYEQGVEVTAVVPNFRPVVQAMKGDGWILQKYSRGEIA